MDFGTIFGELGCLAAFITFLMPARILYAIEHNASENDYPYHVAIVSCTLWVMYGRIHGDQNLVTIIYLGLFFLHIIYLAVFFQSIHLKQSFTRTRMLKNYSKHLVIVLVELFCFFPIAYLALISRDPDTFAGTVCATGNTVIVVMRMMLERNRRLDFRKFAAIFVNGFYWIVYALITSDRFILVPNLVEVILRMVQMVYFVIRHRSGQVQHQI